MKLSDNLRLCTVLREQADLAATVYAHNRHLYWFVRAYHCITEEQAWHICNNHFRETGLLTDIIVRFHELYYREIMDYLQKGSCAPHWEKVFRSAGIPGKPYNYTFGNLYQGLRILRQSIHAHVNTDLCICLQEFAFEISMRKPAFEQDYLLMNQLLHKAAIRFSREMLAAFQPRFVSIAQLYHLVTAGFTHRWIIQVRMKAYHTIAA